MPPPGNPSEVKRVRINTGNINYLFETPYGAEVLFIDSTKIENENNHEITIESKIEDAIENKNYKLAIRLYYLFALKKLTDSGSIEWAPGKSNHDYYYELKRKAAKEHFSSLSRLFEYAWYGGFKIEKPLSDNSRKYFKLLLSDLKI